LILERLAVDVERPSQRLYLLTGKLVPRQGSAEGARSHAGLRREILLGGREVGNKPLLRFKPGSLNVAVRLFAFLRHFCQHITSIRSRDDQEVRRFLHNNIARPPERRRFFRFIRADHPFCILSLEGSAHRMLEWVVLRRAAQPIPYGDGDVADTSSFQIGEQQHR
jgi:hypothetical protein